MQGMRFLLLNEKGPINHGIITQRVTEDKYLCTFMRNPQSSRLVTTDEITTWNLFPNDEALNAFIAAIPKQDPGAPAPDGRPPKDNSHKKPPAIKAIKKKAKAKKATAKASKKQNRK